MESENLTEALKDPQVVQFINFRFGVRPDQVEVLDTSSDTGQDPYEIASAYPIDTDAMSVIPESAALEILNFDYPLIYLNGKLHEVSNLEELQRASNDPHLAAILEWARKMKTSLVIQTIHGTLLPFFVEKDTVMSVPSKPPRPVYFPEKDTREKK